MGSTETRDLAHVFVMTGADPQITLKILEENSKIVQQLLRDHSEGLIGMSACLGGEIAQTIS